MWAVFIAFDSFKFLNKHCGEGFINVPKGGTEMKEVLQPPVWPRPWCVQEAEDTLSALDQSDVTVLICYESVLERSVWDSVSAQAVC